MKIDKMVEQTNQSENNFMKSERQNGDKTGHTCVKDGSYDKDVVEIKLPDTVFSSDYGGHFVKDVCIDEGVHADQKTTTAKLVDQIVSPDFESSMGDIKGDLTEEIRVKSTKSACELKSQIVILPVMCANTAEQYSSSKMHELEGSNTSSLFTDRNKETSSPQQPTHHETANGSQQAVIVTSEGRENQEPFLNGGAADKVSSNDFHETGIGTASEMMSNIIHNDLAVESTGNELPVVMPEEGVVSSELDKGGSNQVNHYNPFIAYGSLEDKWEPKYSLPTVVDAASIAPICPVEKTDSFSDLVNHALRGFDSVGIAEAIIEENRSDSVGASSSMLDVQASEDSNGQRGGHTNETRTDVANDTGMDTSLSASNAEPTDVKNDGPPKSEIDSSQDVHDFNPRDVTVCTKRNEDNTDSKSSTHVQTELVIQQNGTDSAKVTTQSVIHNPFESSFSGPSITSDPLTPSGHIPYSGNISLRSESSTTSTRSFAFPVLQTEWNSSPVKMAKADRKRLRGDRGWSYRILCCCKF